MHSKAVCRLFQQKLSYHVPNSIQPRRDRTSEIQIPNLAAYRLPIDCCLPVFPSCHSSFSTTVFVLLSRCNYEFPSHRQDGCLCLIGTTGNRTQKQQRSIVGFRYCENHQWSRKCTSRESNPLPTTSVPERFKKVVNLSAKSYPQTGQSFLGY